MTDLTSTHLPMPKCRNLDIEEASISDLQHNLENGLFSSYDLVQCYLQRISQVNSRVRSVIETNPDALAIARAQDIERSGGRRRGPLHGIPYILKDNIASKDKMQTTAGSGALEGTIVSADAHIVNLLRQAGAILLGKANLSEFASMRASYYAEGYTSRGGQSRNPFNLAHHAGGSSSGSASSVSVNMCAFSIGTETDGSIMFPADRNSLVGIKPTLGLVSTHGVIPDSPSMDTIGPLARSVADAAIVLDAIAESTIINTSAQSGITCNNQPLQNINYSSCISTKSDLQGARFGMPWKRVWEQASMNKEATYAYRKLLQVIEDIKNAGAEIVDVDFPSAEEIISPDGWSWGYADGKNDSILSEFTVVRMEFPGALREYLANLENNPRNIHDLRNIMDYNIENTGREGGVSGTHPAWPTGQDCFDRCLESEAWDADIHDRALSYIRQKSREEGIDAALQHEGSQLDGLLVPLQADGGVACSVAAKAGYPMIAVPVDVDDLGIPFGIAIMQTAFGEGKLIRYGSAIEDLCRGRKLPRFLNFHAENYPYVGTPSELDRL